MERRPPEPGLLPIFRLYIAMRLGVILSSGVIYLVWYRSYAHLRIAPYAVLFLLDIAFLFIFLGWPWLQRKLGPLHLPIALTVATVIPIVEAQYLRELYGSESLPDFWLVFPFLLVPLLLTAWQYQFQYVIVFVLQTGLLDLVLVSSPTSLGAADAPTRVNLLVFRSVLFLLIGYIISNLAAVQRRQRRDLTEANRKLIRYAVTLERLTISRERNRIARELHDTLAHTLSGVAVQLEAIDTIWRPIPDKAREMLNRALGAARTGLDETRRTLQDLRAIPLEDLGLSLAVRGLADGAAARGGFSVKMEVSDEVNDLPPEVEQTYYRVTQEALENVIQHANARQVTIFLGRSEGRLVLEISDDGSGFAQASVDAGRQLGLVGMRERAELIGGTLEVETDAEKGTTIRLSSEVLP